METLSGIMQVDPWHKGSRKREDTTPKAIKEDMSIEARCCSEVRMRSQTQGCRQPFGTKKERK
jgi:hypothetical protein